MRLAPTNLLAALALVGAGLTDGSAQTALWVAAIAVNYLGPYLTGVAGFTVHPEHFVERHGLIIIIALGESVVAIGAGGDEIAVDWRLAGTALVVMALVAGLWWDYFTGDAEAGGAPSWPPRATSGRLARPLQLPARAARARHRVRRRWHPRGARPQRRAARPRVRRRLRRRGGWCSPGSPPSGSGGAIGPAGGAWPPSPFRWR